MISIIEEKPVMSKTSLTCGCMFRSTRRPPLAFMLFWSMRKTLSPWLEV